MTLPTKDKKKQSKLEELVKNEKTKLKPLELIFLEDLINSFLKNKNDAKITKKIEALELPEIQQNNNQNIENEIKYSIALERKKENKDNFAYSVSIKYEENENEEKLNVKIKFDGRLINKDNFSPNKKLNNNEEYSIAITKEKENKTKKNSDKVFHNNPLY